MTAPAVQPPPRERAPAQYQELNEQRYRQQVDEELNQKHDRRSNLRLGRGRSLVLSSPSGLEYAIALDDAGFLTVTDYSTGVAGTLTVRFNNVEGLAQEFIDVRAEFAAADGALSSAYIAADAVVAANAASATASLSTTLSAAFQSGDAALQGQITTNTNNITTAQANISTLFSTTASHGSAISTLQTNLAAEVSARTGADTALQTDINTRATITQLQTAEATLNGAISTVSGNLSAEVTNRTNGDSNLQGQINTATGNITTNSANISTLQSASATNTSAIATLQTNLSAETTNRTNADTALQNDINTRATSAALSSEASARASADAAEAASRQILQASVEKNTKQIFVDNFNADGYYWTTAFGGTPETIADPANFTYTDVANVGRVAELSTFPRYLTPKAAIKPFVGMKLRIEARVRTTVNPTSGQINAGFFLNGLNSAWVHGSGSFSSTASGTTPQSKSALVTSDGFVTIATVLTCTAISSDDAGWRPRLDITHTGGGGTVQIAYFRIEDVTETQVVQAQVTNIAQAYATNNASFARLVWRVNTSTNVATIEQTAATGFSDGTWNGSAIKLSADLLELLAKDINFGTNTSYEDTYATIYAEKNSRRLRLLGPFPASDDIVLWFGPTSVALNSESKTNGHFCLATDGKVYYGSAELSTGGASTQAKVLGPAADTFSSNSTWHEFASLDVTNVPSGGFISMLFIDIVGQSQSSAIVGAGYQWRLTEAPTSSPTTKTVVKSGNFTVTAGGGGDPPTVDSIDQPSAQLVAVTNTGSVRYKIEIQRTSGTATIGLQATANIIINPG